MSIPLSLFYFACTLPNYVLSISTSFPTRSAARARGRAYINEYDIKVKHSDIISIFTPIFIQRPLLPVLQSLHLYLQTQHLNHPLLSPQELPLSLYPAQAVP